MKSGLPLTVAAAMQLHVPLLILLPCITADFRTASSVSGRLRNNKPFGTFDSIEIVWIFSPASPPLLLFRQALLPPKRKG